MALASVATRPNCCRATAADWRESSFVARPPMLSIGLLAVLLVPQASRAAAGAPQGGPAPTAAAAAADTGLMRHANRRTPPLAQATRLRGEQAAVRVDGRLDEPAWAQTPAMTRFTQTAPREGEPRSEEHTSELQSPCNLVCRLLLEKK